MSGVDTRASKQPSPLQGIGDAIGQRPAQPRSRNGGSSAAPLRATRPPAGRSRYSTSRPTSISSHRAHGASQASPSAFRSPFAKPKGGTVSEPEEASSPRATSSRNAGQDHSGMVGDIERNQPRSPLAAFFAITTEGIIRLSPLEHRVPCQSSASYAASPGKRQLWTICTSFTMYQPLCRPSG